MSRSGSPFAVVAVGFAGGLFAGLFGVGGGILMVPGLLWATGTGQRRAHATTLAAIVPIAALASVLYLARGAVDPPLLLLLSTGSVVGALLGVRLLRRVPEAALRALFAVFALAAGVRLVIQ